MGAWCVFVTACGWGVCACCLRALVVVVISFKLHKKIQRYEVYTAFFAGHVLVFGNNLTPIGPYLEHKTKIGKPKVANHQSGNISGKIKKFEDEKMKKNRLSLRSYADPA